MGGVASGPASRAREGLGLAVPRTGGEARKTTLVEEAIRQFGRDGYHRTSLDSVATAVGVRKQTLLYYFPTKEALLEGCVPEVSARVARALSDAPGALEAD